MIRLLVALCLFVLTARTGVAQARVRGPAQSDLFAFGARPAPVASRDTVAKVIAPTYWKTGLVIGGVAGGLALGFVGYSLCHEDHEIEQSCFGPAVGSTLLGAAVGGTFGALIGGMFRKHEAADSLGANP
jgi:hypothetical protein